MSVFRNIYFALIVIAIPGVAGAWTADNDHQVAPLSGGVFEVVGRPGSAGREFWCAAGDYAQKVLGAKAAQPVYLVRGPAKAQTANWNRAILFSLTAPAGVIPQEYLTLSLKNIGDSLTSSSAQGYCIFDIDPHL